MTTLVHLEDAVVINRRRGVVCIKAIHKDTMLTSAVYVNQALVELRNSEREVWIPEWIAKKQGLRYQA